MTTMKEVTSTATTREIPRSIQRPGVEVVYIPEGERQSAGYTVEPHPPIPRERK